ncbi:hypothetical protein ACTU6U_01470 [Microbacterium sp. A196]|uniref:hypothetical protein n=1 Tax=Microbacterium sp. A196 TaxID=3457320 RepID=UPI003FD5BDDF
MHHRTKLPRRLGERFSIADAEAVGVRPGRHSARDLHRPYSGVRSMTMPETFDDWVRCCALRLKPGQRFGRTTAARLWGLPLPTRWKEGEEIDVVVPTGTTPPKTSRVRGSRLKTERAVTRILKGVPVVDAVAALFMCAPDLTVDQAIVMIDALLTPALNYPDLGPGKPMATLSEIEARLAMWRQFPGQRTIQQALPSARVGVESPKETETRLLIIDSGLPEPVVQFEVRVEGELIARPDLAYPELKIGIEYDGDGHRTDKDEWRRDIQRHRALTAAGWVSLHLTEADLAAGARDAFVAQLRRVMAERRMEITAQTASRP